MTLGEWSITRARIGLATLNVPYVCLPACQWHVCVVQEVFASESPDPKNGDGREGGKGTPDAARKGSGGSIFQLRAAE